MIELEIELKEKKRELLIEMYNIKKKTDLLMNKEFFKNLISFYDYMSKVEGLDRWMKLYEESLKDNCEDCISGKMRLMEKLIFELQESNILENIENLKSISKDIKEVKECQKLMN